MLTSVRLSFNVGFSEIAASKSDLASTRCNDASLVPTLCAGVFHINSLMKRFTYEHLSAASSAADASAASVDLQTLCDLLDFQSMIARLETS